MVVIIKLLERNTSGLIEISLKNGKLIVLKKLPRYTFPQNFTIMPIVSPNFCVGLWFLSHVTFWLRTNHIMAGDNKDACEWKKSFQKETLCSNVSRNENVTKREVLNKSQN